MNKFNLENFPKTSKKAQCLNRNTQTHRHVTFFFASSVTSCPTCNILELCISLYPIVRRVIDFLSFPTNYIFRVQIYCI